MNQRKTIERQFEPGTFATSHSHYAIEDDHIISWKVSNLMPFPWNFRRQTIEPYLRWLDWIFWGGYLPSLSINCKITSEIEIRKHKLVGFVSHMFFHCHEMCLHCFLPSVAWFQLALIAFDCFESFFQSVKYGSIVCRRKFHGKGIKFETFH